MRAALASMLVLALVAPFVPLAGATTHTVTAVDFAWTPDELIIAPGDSVDFQLGSGTHNWVPDFEADPCSLPCTFTFNDAGSYAYHCGFHPSMTGVIHVGSVPTIAISSPAPGASVSGVATVTGSASHASSTIDTVTVTLNDGTPVTATLTGSGNSVTWSANVPTTSAANGAGTISARATTDAGLFATASIPVVVSNPVVIDLALASASAQQGATLSNSIAFVVRNDGNTPTGVTVLAEYFYHGTWRTIGTRELTIVPVGANVMSSISWTPSTPHVGAFDVRVTADPGEVLPDPNRSNNVRTATAGWFTNQAPGLVLTEPV